eukprot:CAMPEP_0180812282 /NCGR_PEP_ID=MMETSP1038_2-20121128/65910_1 /TAXON_ID=632150 /ORGANISM="Azadinium spinosum, Strain 3D9" /LENGTH=55 /DNA_ID=CAMNT_0022853779 /DNA_START=33 /DNA_END=196 /DNA_ORIENTATION=-
MVSAPAHQGAAKLIMPTSTVASLDCGCSGVEAGRLMGSSSSWPWPPSPDPGASYP